ncbi:unknown [Megasphaera elsdenii CAG:570]|uniref:Uncharacterized protein n=1 Tax=Megasphaera elsdenii CAG:570 TaxID=1263087 RepID=R7MW35_MEGEL|nr:unknown [Megasphaera elsdenii CAG:570]
MYFKAESDGRVDFSDFFAGNSQAEEVSTYAAVFFFPGDAEKAESTHFIENSAVKDFFFVTFFDSRCQFFFSKVFRQFSNILLHFAEFEIHSKYSS